MSVAIIFIIILGVLIFVHELGHFVTARRNGIKADEFGFGFPPRAIGFQFLYENGKRKKWRIIWGSRDGDDKKEKRDLAEAENKNLFGGTIYSLNWIPLGGFVKIKGEDGGDEKDPDSFANKSAWVRTKVLAAGVTMNFILAWFLISIVFMLGAPQEFVELVDKNIPIEVAIVSPDSPAEQAGIKTGDEILKDQEGIEFKGSNDFILYVNSKKGKVINLKIKRDNAILNFSLTPRLDIPEGQGPIGVTFDRIGEKKYPWYEAIWNGAKATGIFIIDILLAIGVILKNLFMGQGAGADVAGPVRIFSITKDVVALGLINTLQFVAIISINLGIINILPIPALDGGRILFIVIEKIKGKPISQKIEQTFHSIGFFLLILLLVLVTLKDLQIL